MAELTDIRPVEPATGLSNIQPVETAPLQDTGTGGLINVAPAVVPATGLDNVQPVGLDNQSYLEQKGQVLNIGLPPMTKKTWKDAFKNIASHPLTYLPYLNAVDIFETGKMLSHSNKVMKGSATAIEKKELEDFLRRQNQSSTLGYDVWNIALRMPAYAIEFMTAGGFIKAIGKAGLKGAAKGALKAAGQQITKETIEATAETLMKESGDQAINRIFRYMAQETAAEQGAKAVATLLPTLAKEGIASAAGKTAIKTAGEQIVAVTKRAAVEAPIRAALAPHRVILDAQNYLTPKFALSTDDQGRIQAILSKSDDDFMSALAKGFANQSIENLSESVGAQLTYLAGVAGKSFPILAKSVILNRLMTSAYDPAKRSRALNLILKSGWSGVLPEMYEERVGDVLRFGLGLQPNLFPDMQQLITEAIAFTIPGMTAAAATGGFEAALGNPYGERAQETAGAIKNVEQLRMLGVLTPQHVDNLVSSVEKAVKADEQKGIFGFNRYGSLSRQLAGPFKDRNDMAWFNPAKLREAMTKGNLRGFLLDYMGIPESRIVSPAEWEQLNPAIEDGSVGVMMRNTYEPMRDTLQKGRNFLFIDEAAVTKHNLGPLVDKLGLIMTIRSPTRWQELRNQQVLKEKIDGTWFDSDQAAIEEAHRPRAKKILEAITAEGIQVDVVRPTMLAMTPSEFQNATGTGVEEHDVKSGETRNGEAVYYKLVAGAWSPGKIALSPGASLRDLAEEFIHAKDVEGSALREFRDNVWYPAVKRAISLEAADEMNRQSEAQRLEEIESLKKRIEGLNQLLSEGEKLSEVERSKLSELQQKLEALQRDGAQANIERQKERAEEKLARLQREGSTTAVEPWMNFTKLLRALEDPTGNHGQRAEFFAKAVTNHLGWAYRGDSVFSKLNLGENGNALHNEAEKVLADVFGDVLGALRVGVSRDAVIKADLVRAEVRQPDAPAVRIPGRPATPEEIEAYAKDELPAEDRAEAGTDLLQFSLLSLARDARKADPGLFRIEGQVLPGSSLRLAYTTPGMDPRFASPEIQRDGNGWHVAHQGHREFIGIQSDPPTAETVKAAYVRLLERLATGQVLPTPAETDAEREARIQAASSKNFPKAVEADMLRRQAEPTPLGQAKDKPKIVESGPSIAQTLAEGAREANLPERKQERLDRIRFASQGTSIPYRPEVRGVARGRGDLKFQPILERSPDQFDAELVPDMFTDDFLYGPQEWRSALPSWLLEHEEASEYALNLLQTGFSAEQVVDRLVNETDFLDLGRVQAIIEGKEEPAVEQAMPFDARDTKPNLLEEMAEDLGKGIGYMRRSVERYRGQGKGRITETIRAMQPAGVSANEFRETSETDQETIREFYTEDESERIIEELTKGQLHDFAEQLRSEQAEQVDTDESGTAEDVNTLEPRYSPVMPVDRPLVYQLKRILFGGETLYRDIARGETSNFMELVTGTNHSVTFQTPFLFELMTKRNPNIPNPYDKLQDKTRALVKEADGVILFFNPFLDELYSLPMQRLVAMAQNGRYPNAFIRAEAENEETAAEGNRPNLDPLRAQMNLPTGNVHRANVKSLALPKIPSGLKGKERSQAKAWIGWMIREHAKSLRDFGHGYRAVLVVPTNLNIPRAEMTKAFQAWMVQNRVRNLGIMGLEKSGSAESFAVPQQFIPALRNALIQMPAQDAQTFDYDRVTDPASYPAETDLNRWFRETTPEKQYSPYSVAARAELRQLAGRQTEASRVGPVAARGVSGQARREIVSPAGAQSVQEAALNADRIRLDKTMELQLGPIEGGQAAKLVVTGNEKLLQIDIEALQRESRESKLQDEGNSVRWTIARNIMQTMVTRKSGESEADHAKRLDRQTAQFLTNETNNPGRPSLAGERFRKILQVYQQRTETRFSLKSLIVDATRDGQNRPDFVLASKLLRALTNGTEEARSRQQWALDWLIRRDKEHTDLFRAVAGRAQRLARQIPVDGLYSLVSVDNLIENSPWRVMSGKSAVQAASIRALRLRAAHAQSAWLRSQKWRTLVPDPKIQDLITHAREGDIDARRALEDYDQTNGNTNAITVLEEYGRELDREYAMLNAEAQSWNEEGWIRFITNYAPHYWTSSNGQPVRANLERWRLATSREKRRTIPTIQEGKDFGLIPATENAFDLYERYVSDVWSVAANKFFFHSVRQMVDANGARMVVLSPVGQPAIESPAPGYIRMESPFKDFSFLWVHPEAKFGFEMMFGKKWSNRPLEIIEHFNQWTKYLALGMSLFHHFSLIESLIAQTGRRWISDIMEARSPKEAWNSPFNFLRIIKKAASGELLEEMVLKPELLEDALMHGLTVGFNPNVDVGLITRDLDIAENWVKQHNLPLGEAIIRAFRGVKDWNEKKLWMQGQSATKLYLYGQLLERLTQDARKNGANVDLDQLKEELAKFMNVGYGGMEWAQYTWATPKIRQLMHLFIFAPDWTFSNLNIAGIPALFGQKYSKMEVEMMLRDYWPAMIFTITALPAAIQAAVYGAFGDPDKDNPWMPSNEEGKRTYIDVTPIVRGLDKIFDAGWMGPGGNQRWYLRYGKQTWEVVDWLEAPYRTMMAKTSMAFKTVFEQVTGTNTSGWELDFKDMSFWESIYTLERPKAIAEKFLPMSIQTILEGRPSTFFAPLSKGMSRGRATAIMTELLDKYAEARGFPALNRIPDHKERMIEVVDEVAEAAKANGYDPQELLASARRSTLGRLYEEFWQAINRGDLKKAETTADSIVRIGGVLDGVNRSMERKYGTVGMAYDASLSGQVRDVLREAEARAGLPASLSLEERRAFRAMEQMYRSGPVTPESEDPLVLPAQSP